MMKNTKLLFSALVSAATLSCAPALFSADLTWNGSDGDSWDKTSENWLNNGNATSFATDDNVEFGSNDADETVVVFVVSPGNIAVSGAYTYTGGFVVVAKSLEVSDGGALTLSDGSVWLEDGLTVGAGSTLTINNDAMLASDTISIVLSEANLTTAAIDGSGLLAGTKEISLSLDETLARAIAASETGLSFQILGGELAGNSSGIDVKSFSVGGTSSGESYTWSYEAGVLTIAALPEPSAFGLLAGLGALALVAARRRRSRKA